MPDNQARPDTFPRLLFANAERLRGRPAMREKDLGIWQTWTWDEVAAEVRMLACGLAARGFKRGDTLAIIGDNRPRLYWAMAAAQALGGVPVPLYQDAIASEMVYVFEDAAARFAIVEDQEQVDKLLEILPRCPLLEHIVYDDARGMRHYHQPQLQSYDALTEAGRAFDAGQPDYYAQQIAQGGASDVGIMLYTSGTTGKPKGVCQTHHAFIVSAQGGVGFDRLGPDDSMLSYLPMAWVGDHLFSYAQWLVAGFTINCPESGETVMTDLKEIGPTYYFAPPRVFENLLTTVMIRMEDASAVKRALFAYFTGVARRCGAEVLDGKPVALLDRLLYAIGNLLIYGPLRNVLGMSRIRVAYTAGAAIGPDLFRFYRSIGVNLKQLYGQTEASVYVTLQPDGEIKPDTVGRPAPSVDIRLAPSGEVEFSGPGVFQGYFKDPEKTAEVKTQDGYVRTGDVGFFDATGHLKIIDRAKDVGRLTHGGLFPPKYIENKLKFYPNIKEAVAFGHARDHVACFINIDPVAVGNWAERNNVTHASYQELAADPRVYEMIAEHVEEVNEALAAEPQMAGARITRFLILPKELDADDGELTRTQKVRRSFITERYASLVKALYDGSALGEIRTEITFEDGRKGMVEGKIVIRDVTVAPKPGLEAAA